jgi:hypothetical protein
VYGSVINRRSAPLTPPYIRVSFKAVCNPSLQSLFKPIETILYFFRRLQVFLRIGHPISENKCYHSNSQKDCVQPFPTGGTYAVLCNSFPAGIITSVDFSILPSPDYRDLPQVIASSFTQLLPYLNRYYFATH